MKISFKTNAEAYQLAEHELCLFFAKYGMGYKYRKGMRSILHYFSFKHFRFCKSVLFKD